MTRLSGGANCVGYGTTCYTSNLYWKFYALLENQFLVNVSCFSAATVCAADAGIILGNQYIIYTYIFFIILKMYINIILNIILNV